MEAARAGALAAEGRENAARAEAADTADRARESEHRADIAEARMLEAESQTAMLKAELYDAKATDGAIKGGEAGVHIGVPYWQTVGEDGGGEGQCFAAEGFSSPGEMATPVSGALGGGGVDIAGSSPGARVVAQFEATARAAAVEASVERRVAELGARAERQAAAAAEEAVQQAQKQWVREMESTAREHAGEIAALTAALHGAAQTSLNNAEGQWGDKIRVGAMEVLALRRALDAAEARITAAEAATKATASSSQSAREERELSSGGLSLMSGYINDISLDSNRQLSVAQPVSSCSSGGGSASPTAAASVQDFIVKAAEQAAAARGLLTPGGGRDWQRTVDEASAEAVAEAREQWTWDMETTALQHRQELKRLATALDAANAAAKDATAARRDVTAAAATPDWSRGSDTHLTVQPEVSVTSNTTAACQLGAVTTTDTASWEAAERRVEAAEASGAAAVAEADAAAVALAAAERRAVNPET